MLKVLATALLLLLAAGCAGAVAPADPPPPADAGPACADDAAYLCLGNVVRGCLNGAYDFGVCPYACVDGFGCIGRCVPGDTRTEGAVEQTCSATGSWR